MFDGRKEKLEALTVKVSLPLAVNSNVVDKVYDCQDHSHAHHCLVMFHFDCCHLKYVNSRNRLPIAMGSVRRTPHGWSGRSSLGRFLTWGYILRMGEGVREGGISSSLRFWNPIHQRTIFSGHTKHSRKRRLWLPRPTRGRRQWKSSRGCWTRSGPRRRDDSRNPRGHWR